MQAQLTIALALSCVASAASAQVASSTQTVDAASARIAVQGSTQTVDADELLEAVEVVDRRIDHPFDPHAARVLTGRRIAELGVTNLAEALEHIPAAYVRTAGRGGLQVDVRGARKGALLVLLDGMPISDPFFGNFDVASIPATDIAEIRVSNAPASPVDGAGGNGGVVEVITRSAAGRTRAFARASAGTAPGGRGAVSAKGELGDGFALRVSGSGNVDARSFSVQPTGGPAGEIAQSGRGATGAALVEYVGEHSRIGIDVAAATQSYVVPPSEDEGAELSVVDRESTLRASALGEVTRDALRVSMRAFAHSLSRTALRYRSANLATTPFRSQVDASRYGAFARADWALSETLSWVASASLVSESGLETGDNGDGAEGQLSVVQVGTSARWQPLPWWGMDLAGGAAVPLSGGGDAWPEARLAVELTSELADLTLIGARKGRMPTLRERFQPNTGNAAIGPEQSLYGEATLVLRPTQIMALTASGWVRDIDGLIKIPLGGNQLDNVGTLLTGGLDARLDLGFFERRIELRVAYQLQTQSGESPYDFFPTHRGDVMLSLRPSRAVGLWVRGRYLGERQDQGVELGDVTTFDAGGWVRIDTVRAIVRVENAFDAVWLAHRGIAGFGRTFWVGLEAETP